ncbi:MAG: amino acid ABC transporter permease [Rhizobiales bacterium]|nr:amino acid ABC transporter permease [Hyphomicrobiales bacterium]
MAGQPGIAMAHPAPGPRGWFRRLGRRYFGTPLNGLITLVCIGLFCLVVPPLLRWAIVDAVWLGSANDCRAAAGACWSFIREKFFFTIFGLYPFEQRWRPALVLVLVVLTFAAAMTPRLWSRATLIACILSALAMFALMIGGFAGLPHVPTRSWGGLIVTFFIVIFGLTSSYPLAIALALGRRSRMPLYRIMATGFIEIVRSVPLITVLFMSAIMLPLFLPGDVSIDRLFRVFVAYAIFSAAFLAEAIRGGLQAIPQGQYEAADALGLSYWRKMRLIILPQALKMTIPPQVNTLIGLFKDTTLVVVVGILDFFTTIRAALGDPNWLGFSKEAYIFAALVYLCLCTILSRYSRFLEHRLSPERRA